VLHQRSVRVSLFILLCASLAPARDLALVSNKSNTVGMITVPDLVKVCKAQTNRWPDGKPVTFVMRSPSAPEMKVVLEKIYAMSENEVNGLIVTSNHGRPAHPAIVVATSDEDLAINSSVSVVKVAGKLPLEPGYLLHGN